MTTKQADEMRQLSDGDLETRLEATYRELFNVRVRLATLQLQNHRELPRIKKTIARIKTIQRERDLARTFGA